MKKSKSNFFLLFLSSLLMLSIFSCQKEDLVVQEESPASISATAETPEMQQRTRGNCTVDYNDIGINIDWAADCSTATITLSLCCECAISGGTQTGCTLTPGVLEMQTEECPFDFYLYQQNVPWISIPAGSCYDLEFEIQNQGCDVAFVSQLWFEGDNVDVNYDSSQAYCP